MNGRVRFAAALLTLALMSSPLCAAAQTQADGTSLVQAPSSGVRIDRVDFYSSGRGSSPWWGSECVAITNVGSRRISQVTLDYAWTQASGSPEFDEFAVFNGPLVPGAVIGMLNGRAANSPSACRPTNHGTETGSSNGQVHAFVIDVVYQDGTTWSLVPAVTGSAVNVRGSPAMLSAVNTYDDASPTALTAWRVSADLLPLACSTITNQSAKAITGVRIAYRHVAVNGTDLGDDALDVHATIPAHGTNTNNCRSFVASLQPELLTYAEQATRSSNSQPPVYLYNGVPSDVSAQVAGVTFADGTSWQSAVASASGQTQSDDAVILQLPSSGTRIDGVDFYKDKVYEGLRTDAGVWGDECAAITNVSDSAIFETVYDFAWVRPYGDAAVNEANFFFGPRVPGASGLVKGQAVGPCEATFYGAKNYASDAQPQVFVLDVYQQGASWSLVPPADGSAVNVPGSPVLLSGVATRGYTELTVLPHGMLVPWPQFPAGPPESACSTIQNVSGRTITDVHITYRHLAAGGADIGDDVLDVHANIPDNVVRKDNCFGFYATMMPGVLAYAQMSQEGPGLETPVYLYKGVPSVISAEVTSVAFADGASWRLP